MVMISERIWRSMLTDFHSRPDSARAAEAFVDVIAPIRPMFVEERSAREQIAS
jgi:hypothetical protein